MSAEPHTVAKPATPKDAPPTKPIDNPFDTLFDAEESDEEWWNEEDSAPSSPAKPDSIVRMTQWPKPPESTPVIAKSVNRASTRRPDKKYSVHKPTREKSRGRQKKANAKAGIKVVTNFSRHQGGSKPVQIQPSRAVGCFVDLAALQALSGEAIQPSGGFWKSKKYKELTRAANTEPSMSSESTVPRSVNERASDTCTLHPGNRKARSLASPLRQDEDLSPNDRPIVIGISIPSANVAEHTLSPQTASSETSNIVRSYEHRTPTNQAPETPTIIITPAHEGSAWSALEKNTTSPGSRPQSLSSVYSQAAHSDGNIYIYDAPPMPQMPASFLEEEKQRIAAEKSCFSPDSDDATTWTGEEDDAERSASRSRVVSSGTLFEEDISPAIARVSRASLSSSPQAAKHGSLSTIATRRRSKGWWNYITTPFLTRSNTIAVREIDNEQPPALPSLAIAAAKAKEAERDGKMWEKQFSPLTPETTTSITSDPWWNGISKDAQLKRNKSEDQSPILHDTRHKVQASTATLPFVLSQSGGFETTTISNMTTGNTDSQLSDHTDRTITTFGLSNDRGVPVLFDAPNSRGLQDNNPFVQPRLGGLNNSSTSIQSATRQIIQPVRAVIVQAPPQPPPQVSQSTSEAPPPPYTPSPARIPRYRAVFPPGHPSNLQYPVSPGPLSPGMQQAMSSGGAIPMSTVPLTPPTRRPINLNSGYPELPAWETGLHFVGDYLGQPSKKARKAESKRRRHEKEDALARRAGGWWRGRGCIPKRGCYGRTGAEGRKRRRWYIGLIVGFISMMILIIVLATTLHRKSNTVIGPSQWLNLTGFPPIFEGLSTVIAPVNIVSNTGCVFPATQWSCDLPKELQASVAPNQPNQPNFILNIQWDNSSATNATFANVTGNPRLGTRTLVGNPVSARQVIKEFVLRARQIVTFIPSPSPPAFAEEFFLGNSTDGIVSSNKAGEPTPFFISFLQTTNTSVSKQQLSTRQVSNSTDPFPNITDIIPAASLNADGTAAPANLLPLPVQQPIRLYDRGLPTEHYGFYTYFDRSIFLKSLALLNDTNATDGEVPDDQNGGATDSEAAFRCTWAQTRFLVQMWTRMNSTQLLNSTSTGTSSNSTSSRQPGSFPYPITITTDRHGGDPTLKMLYCYGMNDREGIISTSGQINAEDRGFGGTLINEAPSVFSNSSDPSLGGFDGGTGGCKCQWSNFQSVTNI